MHTLMHAHTDTDTRTHTGAYTHTHAGAYTHTHTCRDMQHLMSHVHSALLHSTPLHPHTHTHRDRGSQSWHHIFFMMEWVCLNHYQTSTAARRKRRALATSPHGQRASNGEDEVSRK